MFLQRFTSEASPISTAAASFFFHTWERQAESEQSHMSLLAGTVCRLLPPRSHYDIRALDQYHC